MKTRSDTSFGIIPVRWVGDAWQVLLINQYSRIGQNSYWVFPKGHPEANETPRQTATRELQEETGLDLDRIVEDPSFSVSYQFIFEHERIEKRAVFFVGEVQEGELTLDPEEVIEARWLSLAAAMERLDYDDTKAMFAEACRYLQANPRTS